MKCEIFTERKKWSQNGSRVELFSCPQDGPHLGTVLVNMIIKEKNGSTLQSGTIF